MSFISLIASFFSIVNRLFRRTERIEAENRGKKEAEAESLKRSVSDGRRANEIERKVLNPTNDDARKFLREPGDR